MALNPAAPPEDPIFQTAIKRQFARSLVGDFTFDCARQKYRHKILLSRNMTRVLAFHEKNRIQQTDLGGRVSTRRRGPYLGDATVKGPLGSGSVISSDDVRNDLPKTEHIETSSPILDNENDTPSPDIECISRDCLKVRAQMESLDTPQRRSLRRQLVNQYQDKDAHLTLDLRNIRKKLNFKEITVDCEIPTSEVRPRKRAKRDSIPCHCHVTIWDSRIATERREPIVRKSEICEVITSSSDDGSFSVDIELASPFRFRSTELRVPVEGPDGTVLTLGDKYFLEVKIIPARENVQWPPIPFLGRSEGDQSTELGQLAAEKLQGAMVMRYLHLPQAPKPETPWSVYLLRDGKTYRSKYGLEVRSFWTKGIDSPRIKGEIDGGGISPWAVDDDNRLFGRSHVEQPSRPSRHSDIKPAEPIQVSFNFESMGSREAREFRKANVIGLKCPVCTTLSFDAVEQLQFHFMTFHSKFKFTVDKEIRDPLTETVTSVIFKVTSNVGPKLRQSDRQAENRKDTNWSWTAPTEPFDLPAFVDGDQKWVNDLPKKKASTSSAQTSTVIDPFTALRQQNGGFLPAEHVPPFRSASRKKHPLIRLNTLSMEKSIPYTSVSHRQRHVSEEPQSETDDEMDSKPFVQKSLEYLDVAADRYEWQDEDRTLRSKWNRARFAEQLSHPRYLSDCLIRFVRHEKVWLTQGGTKVRLALANFLQDLTARRVINEEVVRDTWCILYGSHGPTPQINGTANPDVVMQDTETASLLTGGQAMTPRQLHIESMMALPDSHCGKCGQFIPDIETRGLHCSELACEAPGVWYHTRCVRCKIRDKLAWKCQLCVSGIDDRNGQGGINDQSHA